MDTVVVVVLLVSSMWFTRRAWEFIPDSDWFYLYTLGLLTCLVAAYVVTNGGSM